MKKILLLLAFMPFAAQSQVSFVTLKTGTDGYVMVNNNNFQRGVLFSQYRWSDSTLTLIYANNRNRFCLPLNRRHFWNGDTNDSFYTFSDLITWVNAHFEPITGTASLDYGDTIKGPGATNGILYADGNNKLSNDLNLTWDGYTLNVNGLLNNTYVPTAPHDTFALKSQVTSSFVDSSDGGSTSRQITIPAGGTYSELISILPLTKGAGNALYITTSTTGYYILYDNPNQFTLKFAGASPSGTKNIVFKVIYIK